MRKQLHWSGFISAALAWLAWCEPGWTFVALLVLPVWSVATKSRWHLFSAAWLYYGVAMHELIYLPRVYFTLSAGAGYGVGIAAWLVWSGLLAAVMAAGWHPDQKRRTWQVPLVALAINLPPLGWFSMASPWTATGFWFAGLGWIGIGAALALCVAIACLVIDTRSIRYWGLLLGCASFVGISSTAKPAPSTWHVDAVQTVWGVTALDSASQYQRVQDFVSSTSKIDKRHPVVAWPESAMGQWSAKTEYWLGDRLVQPPAGQTWIVGAVRRQGDRWVNGFLLWKSSAISPVFIDGRIPMPVGMWHPDGFKSSPWSSSTVSINGKKIGVSICYEDLLPWTAWQLHSQGVDTVVSVSSMWFSRGLNLNRNAAQSAQGWAMLFGVPYARSVNF